MDGRGNEPIYAASPPLRTDGLYHREVNVPQLIPTCIRMQVGDLLVLHPERK